MTERFSTPIRRLEGVAYWVIEDPDGINDYINTEIRKEWEADARSERRDPSKDDWLQTLSRREWSLQVVGTDTIRLNPDIMYWVDSKRGYSFRESLAKRSRELQGEIETHALVIWPVIVKKEDMLLVDGYCRYSALKAVKVKKIYAYAGSLKPRNSSEQTIRFSE